MLAGCNGIEILKTASMELWDQSDVKYRGYYKVGNPYRIAGKWYYPHENENYREDGIASWYGDKFHRKLTANGEIFYKGEISAAHRTLPLPSMVRVTNIESGKTLLIRVNDRGPFAKDRIIDLSEKAAMVLGMKEAGTAMVRVEFDKYATEQMFSRSDHASYIRPKDKAKARKTITMVNPDTLRAAPFMDTKEKIRKKNQSKEYADIGYKEIEPVPKANDGYYIQTGAFGVYDNAVVVMKKLRALGKRVFAAEVKSQQAILYRVRLGPLDSLQEADDMLQQVERMGYGDAIIITN